VTKERRGDDVKLTTFTDYSLRVLIYVASAPEGRATIAEIAKAFDISENHLVKVVHLLGREGILLNTRGRGGGLALARPAREVNVGAVVRLAEGRDCPAECFGEDNTCAIAPVCRLAGILDEAFKALYRVLDGYSLADLVENRKRIASILHIHPRAP
jgi:Rrf2 family nitric oxide-sensitive transcriptional repressor